MNKKILIIGNGGLIYKNGQYYGNKDTGTFIRDLKTSGIDVTFCDIWGNFKANTFLYTYNFSELGIDFHIIEGKKPKAYLAQVRLFLRILKSPQVYIYYPGGQSKFAAKYCQWLRKKYGVYVRGNGLSNDTDPDNVITRDPILLHAAYFITVSPGLAQQLNILNKPVSLIKPMMAWTISDNYKRTIAKKSYWKLLYVGSITKAKGIHELIGMIDHINKSGIKIELDLIGDGDMLETLRSKKEKGEIPGNINFIGAVIDKTRMQHFYEQADIFVFASHNEGFPRVLYEAMLKMLPIYTTMVGGIPALMKDHYNCIEIPVKKPEQQAKIVSENFGNTKLLNEIIINGLKTVEKVLTERLPHSEIIEKHLHES